MRNNAIARKYQSRAGRKPKSDQFPRGFHLLVNLRFAEWCQRTGNSPFSF